MGRTGRKEQKSEMYKVTAVSMLMCNYASWTEKVWINIWY